MPPPAEFSTATKLSEPANEATSPPDEEDDLLSSVCHDLREPLASIVMGTGLLRKLVHRDDMPAMRVIEAIRRAAIRMGDRISIFADLATLEAGDLELDARLYDVAPIVQTAVQQFLPDATARHVSVSLELGRDIPASRISCDRERLLQILRHLCACALRVAQEGASIALSAIIGAVDSVLFAVATRQPLSSKGVAVALPKPELAIAKGLIELHGGSLAIVSDSDALCLSFALGGTTR